MSTLVGMTRHNIYIIYMLGYNRLQGNINIGCFSVLSITFVRLEGKLVLIIFHH